jgi:ABC-2 type transport system permease protein
MSTDALIMLRRNCKHTARNPVTVFNAVLLPVVIMLMFVYLLGNAFSVGVRYIDYATPGMILLAVRQLGLKEGSEVSAVIKASDVIMATSG